MAIEEKRTQGDYHFFRQYSGVHGSAFYQAFLRAGTDQGNDFAARRRQRHLVQHVSRRIQPHGSYRFTKGAAGLGLAAGRRRRRH